MKLKLPLKDYQEEGVNFLSNRAWAYLLDELGTGKTIQSIATAIKLKSAGKITECLIVCPASLKYQWADEIEKFTDESKTIIEGPQKKRIELYNNGDFFKIVNYELVLRDIEELRKKIWGCVICDEVTRIKSMSAKTSFAVKSIPKNYRYALSGIPVEKSPEDLYSLQQFLMPMYFGNYWWFRGRYIKFKRVKMGSKSWWEVLGYKNLDELHEKMKEVSIRRTKADVFEDLPERIDHELVVELTDDQKKVYKEIKEMIKKQSAEGSILDKIMYLRRLCDDVRVLEDTRDDEIRLLLPSNSKPSNKMIEVTSLIDNFSEEKVVVFTNWVKSQRVLYDFLRDNKHDVLIVNGTMTQSAKNDVVKLFNESDPNTILIATDCLTYGVNLQTASVLIHLDAAWSWAKMQQRSGRIDRIGQCKTVNVFNIVTKGTIEQKVMKILKDKKEMFEKIIVGEQGRQLLEELI